MSETKSNANQPIGAAWFELPASDLERAIRFYEGILGKPMRRETMGGTSMGVFPYQQQGVGGAVVVGMQPTANGAGPVVYLTAESEFDAILSRIEAAGGKIATPKMNLPNIGAIALFIDTEGNRVGLHAAP